MLLPANVSDNLDLDFARTALFYVCKHMHHEGIVLPTSLLNFEFYTSNYASVFAFEYLSNLGTMPTSLTSQVNITIYQGVILSTYNKVCSFFLTIIELLGSLVFKFQISVSQKFSISTRH